MSSTCQTCAPSLRRRRGSRSHARFGATDTGHVVLTIPRSHEGQPPALADYLGPPQLSALRRLGGRMLSAWMEDHTGLRTGGYVAFHPEGDRRPGKWAPHLHYGLPLIGLSAAGELIPILPMRPRAALADLRARWGELLTAARDAVAGELRALGAAEAADEVEALDCTPIAHWSYQLGAQAVGHRLGYDLRPFVRWSAALPRGLRSQASWGLAVGALRAGAEWRAAVRRPPEDEPEEELHPSRRWRCTHEGCEHRPRIWACEPVGEQPAAWQYSKWDPPLLDDAGEAIEATPPEVIELRRLSAESRARARWEAMEAALAG